MIIAIITVLILASLAFTLWFTLYAPRVWSNSQTFREWSDDNLPE
jgi:hypothetical protein